MPLPEQRDAPEPRATTLHLLNGAPPEEALRLLLHCCGSSRWAHRLAAHRPYPDPEALLAAADEASYDMTHADVREALSGESAHRPPMDGPGALAAHTALRAAHAAYKSRFGHVFLICPDGRSAAARLNRVLAGIRTRLGNDLEEEHAVTADELRRIARHRLTRLLADPPHPCPGPGTGAGTGGTGPDHPCLIDHI